MECHLYVSPNTTDDSEASTLSPSDEELVGALKQWEHFFGTRISVALCCFGVLGNILNLLALTRRSLMSRMGPLEKSATCGLVALALSDFFFCLFNLPQAGVDFEVTEWLQVRFPAYYTVYGQAVVNIFVVSSTWLTVVMALSRYFAICHPLHARLIVDMKFAKGSIIAVFLGSVILVLPRFWHYQIICMRLSEEMQAAFPESHPQWYQLAEGPLGRGSSGWRAYIICHFILAVFLPVLVLAFCNVYLVRALHQSTKMRNQFTRRDRNSSTDTTRIVTLTLTVIVVTNIVLVAPCEVFTFIDQIMDRTIAEIKSHSIYNFLVAVFNVLQVFSFSFNFVLYILINAHFRRAIKEVVTCKQSNKNTSNSTVRYDSVTAHTQLPMTPTNRLSDEDIYKKRRDGDEVDGARTITNHQSVI